MKYIFSFLDVPYMTEDGVKYYTCVNAPWWKCSENIIKRQKPYKHDGESEYQKGLDDAWEAARKIYSMSFNEQLKCFEGDSGVGNILSIYTASEAIEKLEQWEQENDEIQVGDEVITNIKEVGVVTQVLKTRDTQVQVLMSNGHSYGMYADNIKRKTGRHFEQVAELLKQMQEGE